MEVERGREVREKETQGRLSVNQMGDVTDNYSTYVVELYVATTATNLRVEEVE